MVRSAGVRGELNSPYSLVFLEPPLWLGGAQKEWLLAARYSSALTMSIDFRIGIGLMLAS